MPTEGNLNRVSSPGLDRELAALRKAEAQDGSIHGSAVAANRIYKEGEFSQQSEGVIQSSPEVKPQTAFANRAEFIGVAEPLQEDDEPVSVAEVTKLLTEHFARNREVDTDVFRKQVIQAFKHLGLDTRKFFGI